MPEDRILQPLLNPAGFTSLTDLACALAKQRIKDMPRQSRTLATYLSNLDRGNDAWFARRPALFNAVAKLLGVEPEKLKPLDTTGLLDGCAESSTIYAELRRLGVRDDVCLAIAARFTQHEQRIAQLERRLGL